MKDITTRPSGMPILFQVISDNFVVPLAVAFQRLLWEADVSFLPPFQYGSSNLKNSSCPGSMNDRFLHYFLSGNTQMDVTFAMPGTSMVKGCFIVKGECAGKRLTV